MNNITIRDARIIFRNFSGKPTQYTPEGRRAFSVVIDDERFAETLKEDGWNVKPLKQRDPDEPIHYQLPVAVFFGNFPPTIKLRSGDNMTDITEETVGSLDWAEIQKVDLTIRPRMYESAGRKGVKAYLKTMIVTVEEDELLSEYNNVDDDVPF